MIETHVFKETKDEKGLSLYKKIEFGYIYAKRDFLDIRNQSWCLEEMIHWRSQCLQSECTR
jgi:hypothetical protein